MPIVTITWHNGKVKLIDQTKLPLELSYLEIDDYHILCEAIKKLQVRGAPAIGIAGAFGVVLGLQKLVNISNNDFIKQSENVIQELAQTRPTAVNLFWALKRMKQVIEKYKNNTIDQLKQALLKEAMQIYEEDKTICRTIGHNGATLIKNNSTVLTHCNAGALATADFGTALGVIYAAVEQNKKVKVFADETRPLLQGARLTTWELNHSHIDVTLICDNTAASVMQHGKIDAVIVGADRIAKNGDTANKIGTYNLAVLAQFHQVPFYIVAPASTFDLSINNGSKIPIEQRAPEEVTIGFGKRTAPVGVPVYNPAFDVTPHHLISAFVTEQGIIYPPYKEKLKKIGSSGD